MSYSQTVNSVTSSITKGIRVFGEGKNQITLVFDSSGKNGSEIAFIETGKASYPVVPDNMKTSKDKSAFYTKVAEKVVELTN